MKTAAIIIKSVEANIAERIIFDTISGFTEKELIKIIQACTPYKVLPNNKKIKTFAETKLIGLDFVMKYVQHLKFYYEKETFEEGEASTLTVLIRSLPFNIINKVYREKDYTFFRFNKALKYDTKTSYAIIKSLFLGCDIYISSLGDPYIKRKIIVTREDDMYGIYDVRKKYYATSTKTEAKY